MTTTFILSGPSSAPALHLHDALAGVGLTDVRESVNHGLPDGHETRWTGDRRADGSVVPGTGVIAAVDPGYPVSFLQGDGPDEAIDHVIEAIEPFGWRLRSSAKRVGDAERIRGTEEG